jgi:hypothetical protein
VETAAGSLRDLRVAEVTKMDMKRENGKVTAFARASRSPSNTEPDSIRKSQRGVPRVERVETTDADDERDDLAQVDQQNTIRQFDEEVGLSLRHLVGHVVRQRFLRIRRLGGAVVEAARSLSRDLGWKGKQ